MALIFQLIFYYLKKSIFHYNSETSRYIEMGNCCQDASVLDK